MSCLAEDLPTREAPPAPASKAPVTSLTATTVGGVHTDLVVTNYSDRLFIVVKEIIIFVTSDKCCQVSQLGKLGTICEARREKAQSQQGGVGDEGAGRPVYTVKPFLTNSLSTITFRCQHFWGKRVRK